MIGTDKKCIIETSDGPICGYIDTTDEGTFYKFKSIPYAKPPLGNLRFKPSSSAEPWKEVLDCTKDAPPPLSLTYKKEIVGSEDCLYIEVSSPNIIPEKPLPVMFWVGSCNFMYTIDNILEPTLINKEDIVYVRCGFRLGPFGFLSINDFNAPGNNGIKDIILALKWVQKNILKFGGDPNNVTTFGTSSGAAIVHLMMLSPMANGLFHKSILESACALNWWSLSRNPLESTMHLAHDMGITKTDKLEVVEELRKLPAIDIMKTHSSYMLKTIYKYDCFDAIFKPCVECFYEGQPVFLDKSPASILKSGNFNKIPFIIGSNNTESAVLEYMKDNFYEYEIYNKDISLLVPKCLTNVEGESKIKIGQKILNFYWEGEECLTEHTKKEYLQMRSDYNFLYYIDKTIRTHIEVAPECAIYYYVMNYAGQWRVPKELDFFNCSGHVAELPFIYRIKTSNSGYYGGSRDSIKTRKRVVKMWTNFAKYGNPTPDDDDPLLQITWDKVENKDKLNFLSIDTDLTKGRNPFYERMHFWDKIHEEHLILKFITHFIDMGVDI
ncbi:unnamed protein product [Leptidea sinapis]|uniref:Carboxylesterase type B domain-containing protein n=1 Tax=Leptidea sinapis TaxID=189913 RepID=A0A5E4QM67_9NEOP|nr:unnamed protein product [Leptidea sinapis]